MNERIPLFSRPLPVVVLILLALLLDQAVKFAVESWLPFQEPVHVMPMLALYRTYNYGVAFSMLSGMEGWFIVTLRLFVVAFVIWLWRQTPKARRLESSIAMVSAILSIRCTTLSTTPIAVEISAAWRSSESQAS